MASPNIVYNSFEKRIKIIKWKVKEGQPVTSASVILLYHECDSTTADTKKFKINMCGVISKRLGGEGCDIEPGSPLIELSPCIHATVIKDMCADCGEDLRRNEHGVKTDASVPMVHTIPELKVTQEVALELGKADTNRLLDERKLVLLVDLDQTIIHTTNDNVPVELSDIYHFQLYGKNSPWYHTKLRPGTEEFLSKISSIYELHICTFGARNYAHTIAQILDKDGRLFSHRILSRDECLSITSKTENLKALFPCGDSMVCIIDDREDVWNMAPNLIQVKPYHFFQHTGDINAPPELAKHELDGRGINFKDLLEGKGQQMSTISSDNTTTKETSDDNDGKSNDETENCDAADAEESGNSGEEKKSPGLKKSLQSLKIEDPDDYLMYLESILINIHGAFYSAYDTSKEMSDLKLLIPKLRCEVLRGKTLVFSGLVPNNVKLEQSRAFMIAKSLGANVSQHINEETTHLVAASAGTFKVNAARKSRNVFIVTPDWLWCCAERWECVSERLYPLDPHKPSKMRQPPPHCHSPEHVANYAEKSETSVDEPKFIDTINPLLSFSNADLAAMNQEFEQFFESSSSSDEDSSAAAKCGGESTNVSNPRKRKRDMEHNSLKRAYQSEGGDLIAPSADSQPVNDSASLGTDIGPADVCSNSRRRASGSGRNSGSEADNDEQESSVDPEDDAGRSEEDHPSDLSSEPNSINDQSGRSDIDSGDDGDWNMMGAALEREFLGID